MINKEITLSDVAEYFKDNQIPTFDEEIDKFGGYFITAGRIAAVLLAPDPLTKIAVFCAGIDAGSLQASKLFSWLPDKFKWSKKGREKFAIKRYELSSAINVKLLDIAIRHSLKEFIMPLIEVLLKELEIKEQDKDELKKLAEKVDEELGIYSLTAHTSLSYEESNFYASKLIEPILPFLYNLAVKCDTNTSNKKNIEGVDLQKIKQQYLNRINLLYNAFIINFSAEFPEFAVWSDVTKRAEMLKELNKISKSLKGTELKANQKFIKTFKELANKIEQLDEKIFSPESGFPTFKKTYEDLFKLQTEKFESKLTEKIRENIKAHQKQIKAELTRPLSDNEDIEEIVFPKNKEIFISQSFQAISYKKRDHRKKFLTSESLGENCESGEDIGKYLLKTLVDPTYATRPIIILGNPGAGKSMLSKMFAGELSDTNDFIPFLIKLRNVASSSANLSEHINKGLALSIENTKDINWLDWAKEFKERTPVLIMDGFDELMQSSSTELNGYINTIKEFQEKAMLHDICVRIILTSRVAVMQDVTLPEGTKIIKLNSFDEKRRNLWVEKWNSFQTKIGYKFKVPKNEKIENLAQEPLLLTMLAVYDFDKSELQSMSRTKNFNQSRLYDSLLDSFAERQLKKSELYRNASLPKQKEEENLFRMRLGMIALMMFLNDTTSKDTQKLDEELEAFKLKESEIQTSNVLGGFFFIHENKSTTEGEAEKFNYEFLHKTFGEFLTADFLLRTAANQFERKTRDEQVFKFCFGYNWLHKHNNIQNFLFEHAHQVLKPESEQAKYVINEIIIPDLEKLFDKVITDFPVSEIRVLAHKSKIDHLAIYSQNLIFLWVALAKDKTEVKFEIYETNGNKEEFILEPKYEAQDRGEKDQNKLQWKRLSNLWTLVANKNATAKISEWIKVFEDENNISLSKNQDKIKHNFSDASKVECNDFEFLLSIFDNDLRLSKEDKILEKVGQILQRKPEFQILGIDAVLYRFQDLFALYELKLIETLFEFQIHGRQKDNLISQIIKLKHNTSLALLFEVIILINRKQKSIFSHSPQATLDYLKLLLELKPYFSFDDLFHPKIFNEIFENILFEIKHSERPMISIEYFKLFNELIKINSFERFFDYRVFEEILFRSVREFKYTVKENPLAGLEYLKLLSSFPKSFPIRKMFPIEMFEELFRRLYDEIGYFENTNIWVEYLKSIIRFSRLIPIERLIPRKFISELVYRISSKFEHIARSDPQTALDCLRTLIYLKKHYSPKHPDETFDSNHLEEMFYRLFDLIRQEENSPIYIGYLKLVNETLKIGSFEKFIIHRMIEGLLLLGTKEYRHTIIENTQSAMNYLELSDSFNLISKDDPILEAFPKLKVLYSKDREQFSKFLDTFAQMS